MRYDNRGDEAEQTQGQPNPIPARTRSSVSQKTNDKIKDIRSVQGSASISAVSAGVCQPEILLLRNHHDTHSVHLAEGQERGGKGRLRVVSLVGPFFLTKLPVLQPCLVEFC